MKKINKNIIYITSVYSIFLIISNIVKGEYINVLFGLCIIILMFLPKLINKRLKYRIPNSVITIYLFFLISAILLGSIYGFYDIVSYYDKILHFIAGLLSAFIAIVLLINFEKFNYKNIKFNIIYILSITSLVAVFWEIFEYGADIIFDGNAQRVIETGIHDTMQDMIIALVGAGVLCIIYIFEYKTKQKNIIQKFIKRVYENE